MNISDAFCTPMCVCPKAFDCLHILQNTKNYLLKMMRRSEACIFFEICWMCILNVVDLSLSSFEFVDEVFQGKF